MAQLTDSHIFAEPEGALLGLNTRKSFEAVCQRLQKEEWRPDVLLATGDLSQDASAESYQYLASYFKKLDIPTLWLPGNHDDPHVMHKHLNNGSVFVAKQLLLGDWQLILLDSSVSNQVHGFLCDEQLAFLENALNQYPQKHALVSLHHQPLEVGSCWIDKIGLRNCVDFKALIGKHQQVKGVLYGHVHQEVDREIDRVRWIATPSSSVQFTPGSKDFSAGVEAPGYRYLNLYADGRIDTLVHRIDNLEFTVDYSIKGY